MRVKKMDNEEEKVVEEDKEDGECVIQFVTKVSEEEKEIT